MATATAILDGLRTQLDTTEYKKLHWEGTFGDYLDLVGQNPQVTRNAFQRIYDMIMSYGTEEFIDAKKRLIRYKFFSDMSFDEKCYTIIQRRFLGENEDDKQPHPLGSDPKTAKVQTLPNEVKSYASFMVILVVSKPMYLSYTCLSGVEL